MATKNRAWYRTKRLGSAVVNIAGAAYDRVLYRGVLPPLNQPLMIDPRAIVGRPAKGYYLHSKKPLCRGLSRMQDGDWDLNIRPLSRWVRILEAYYAGRGSEEARTVFVAALRARGLTGEALDRELRKTDKILWSIDRHGFQPFNYGAGRVGYLPLGLRGYITHGMSAIGVAVARDGSLLWIGSKHRMAVALGLELNNVPALVCALHREWNGELKCRLPR